MTRMNRRDTASDLSPPDFLLCANWKGCVLFVFWHDDYFMFLLYLQVMTCRIQGTRSQQEANVISQFHQKKTVLTAL